MSDSGQKGPVTQDSQSPKNGKDDLEIVFSSEFHVLPLCVC